MKDYQIARICHETNKAYCEATGDYSQVPWEQAAVWQKDSALEGVKWRLANMDSPVSAQHDKWVMDKINDGWKYGPRKDADKKEHPCIVPYDKLPAHQKTKDSLFVAIVKSCAETA